MKKRKINFVFDPKATKLQNINTAFQKLLEGICSQVNKESNVNKKKKKFEDLYQEMPTLLRNLVFTKTRINGTNQFRFEGKKSSDGQIDYWFDMMTFLKDYGNYASCGNLNFNNTNFVKKFKWDRI